MQNKIRDCNPKATFSLLVSRFGVDNSCYTRHMLPLQGAEDNRSNTFRDFKQPFRTNNTRRQRESYTKRLRLVFTCGCVPYHINNLDWFVSTANYERRQQNNLDRAILIWGVITLLTCIYDVVVTGLLASNYTKLLQLYNDNINTDTLVYAVLAYGTLFSLAARGYVLWVVNLAVSILMIRNGSQRLKTKNTDVYGSGAIDAFEDERNYPQSGQVNQAYNWDNNTSQFNREITQSTSGFGKPGFGGENVQNRQTDHVARLGKQQGPRNYPQNISAPKPPHNYIYPSPHIPRPDYSPLPRLKSALKNYPPPPPKLTRNSNRY